eukprot:COSAG02_NODE_802_length_17030_cov_37.485500_14_plen_97_part_00
MPDNFVMAQFLSIRLRALALAVGQPIVCSVWWGPMAEEVLAQEGLSYEQWQKFGKRESKHSHHITQSRVLLIVRVAVDVLLLQKAASGCCFRKRAK